MSSESRTPPMIDEACDGPLTLPPPSRRTSGQLAASGPHRVLALPSEPAPTTSEGAKISPRLNLNASEKDAATLEDEVHAEWVSVPGPPPPADDVKHFWHYTDAAGLIGILSSSTLRASSSSTLNDSAEYKHGRAILDTLMEEVLDSRHVHPIQKSYLTQILALSDKLTRRPGLFVICASEASDSLAQWRSYGRGQGHALLLNPAGALAVLSEVEDNYRIDSLSYGWRRVMYDVTEQRDLLLRVLGFLAFQAPPIDHFAASPTSEHDRSSASTLISALAYCKDASFAEEREVRIVLHAPGLSDVRFRAGATGVAPFIELTGAPGSARYSTRSTGPLPIEGVAVGPFSGRDSSAEGVRVLLDALGYDEVGIDVSSSTLR